MQEKYIAPCFSVSKFQFSLLQYTEETEEKGVYWITDQLRIKKGKKYIDIRRGDILLNDKDVRY